MRFHEVQDERIIPEKSRRRLARMYHSFYVIDSATAPQTEATVREKPYHIVVIKAFHLGNMTHLRRGPWLVLKPATTII